MKTCAQCGAQNSDAAVFCQGCGSTIDQPTENAGDQATQQDRPASTAGTTGSPQNSQTYFHSVAPPPKKDSTTWLVLNILSCLFCCLPLGIAGAIFAGIAGQSYDKGDYADAEAKTRTARTLFIIGAIGGGILTAIYIMARLGRGY